MGEGRLPTRSVAEHDVAPESVRIILCCHVPLTALAPPLENSPQSSFSEYSSQFSPVADDIEREVLWAALLRGSVALTPLTFLLRRHVVLLVTFGNQQETNDSAIPYLVVCSVRRFPVSVAGRSAASRVDDHSRPEYRRVDQAR